MSPRKTIAEHMRDILIENDEKIVWYGSLNQIHECAKRSGMYDKGDPKYHHPLHVNNRVLSALEKSSLFSKGYIKHVGRPSRAFTLKIDDSSKSE